MINVKILKIEEPLDEQEEPKIEAKIIIEMNVPDLIVDTDYNCFKIKDIKTIVLLEKVIDFQEMKRIMEFHNLKTWKEVKLFIEKKYKKYYLQMLQDQM